MKQGLCLLLCLFLTGIALSQKGDAAKETVDARSPEAIAILKKVDQAVKAVRSVRYRATMRPGGFVTSRAAAAEATSVMVGWNGATPEKLYAHVKTKHPETGEAVELTGGGNGDTYFLIDHRTKKGYEDMDPAVMGSGADAIRGVGMIEFVHDAPFDDELNADSVELQGEETVGNEPCYKIRVAYAGGQGESTWLFSKKDYLPRRRVRHFRHPEQGEGWIEIDVTDLEVDIEPDEGLFKMQLPEGFEQVDDFAP